MIAVLKGVLLLLTSIGIARFIHAGGAWDD